MLTIDIILLTYNDIDNTRECIENIYKYTDDFNLFILDNGSEEETIKYLKELNYLYYKSKGFSRTTN